MLIFFAELLALECRTAKGEYGSCIEIRSCPRMLEILQMKPLWPENVKYLQDSRCPVLGATSSDVIICCPLHSSPTTSAPNWNPGNHHLLPKNCGQQTADRIVGGELADIDEFPWMVLLEYQTRQYI